MLACIAWSKNICDLCKDIRCEAIKFSGLFYPQIDNNLCNNCGKCLGKCFNNAISFKEEK